MRYWLAKFFSQPAAHGRAFAEVFVTTAFSLTLYAGAFLKINATREGELGGKFLERGEVFLLTYALYGTLFYLAFIHIGKPANAPKKFVGLLVSLLAIPIVFMSGFDPTFRSIVNEDVNFWGYVAYGLFLLSYYALLFYQEIKPPDPEQVLEDGARDMAAQARQISQ